MKNTPGMIPGQDFTASGIFTPKSQRFGSGIFADRYSIPTSVYTEPMYAGAQIVPGDMAFFRSALSGGDGLGDVGASWPKWLVYVALAGIGLYAWKNMARSNPRRRRRRRSVRLRRWKRRMQYKRRRGLPPYDHVAAARLGTRRRRRRLRYVGRRA